MTLPKTLSLFIFIILTLSIFSFSFISQDSEAQLPENRNEIEAEDFSDIDQWEDVTDHSSRYGHLNSTDDHTEIEENAMVQPTGDGFEGTKQNYTDDVLDGLSLGHDYSYNSPSFYYDFEGVDKSTIIDKTGNSNHLHIDGDEDDVYRVKEVYESYAYYVTNSDVSYSAENELLGQGSNTSFAFDCWAEPAGDEGTLFSQKSQNTSTSFRVWYDENYKLKVNMTDSEGETETFDYGSLDASDMNYIYVEYDGNDLYIQVTCSEDSGGTSGYRDGFIGLKDMNWENSKVEIFSEGKGVMDNFRTFPHLDVEPMYIDEAHFQSERDISQSYYDKVRIDTELNGIGYDHFNLTLYSENKEQKKELSIDVQEGNNTYNFSSDFEVDNVDIEFGFSSDEFVVDSTILYEVVLIRSADHDSYVNRHGSQDRVESLFSYRMEMHDDSDTQKLSADLSWATSTWNLSDYEYQPFPSSSLYNMLYAVRIYRHDGEGNVIPWDSDEIDAKITHNRYQYMDSDTPQNIESEEKDFSLDYWTELEMRGGGIWDTAGFNISIECSEAFEGHVSVKLDHIRYTSSVSEVYPRMFNQLTGEGLNQDRLIVQYKDTDGSWRYTGGESFRWIEHMQVDLRVLDYWGQTIWNETITPTGKDWVQRIPIPLINLEIQKPEPGVDPPLFSVASESTGEELGRESWNVELIANRDYRFAWGPFGKYLGGSKLIDLTINQLETQTVVQSVEMSEVQLQEEEEGLETEDDDVSNVNHGRAVADLSFNIDPDQSAGYPDLDLYNISNFPEHHLAYIGYELFNIDYDDYNPNEDEIFWDYIFAISDTTMFKVITIIWPIAVFSIWYWRIQNKAVERAEERMQQKRRKGDDKR